MKKHDTAKTQMKVSRTDQVPPLDASATGTWHRIATKAYELYEQRGRSDGHALEDWLTAEADVEWQARMSQSQDDSWSTSQT